LASDGVLLVVSLTSRHEGLRRVHHGHGRVVVGVSHHHHVHGRTVDYVAVVELGDCYRNTWHAVIHRWMHVVAGRRGYCRPIHF